MSAAQSGGTGPTIGCGVPVIRFSVGHLEAPDQQLKAAGGQPVLALIELFEPRNVLEVHIVLNKLLVPVSNAACTSN